MADYTSKFTGEEIDAILNGAESAYEMPLQFIIGVSADQRADFDAWVAKFREWAKIRGSYVFVENEGTRERVKVYITSNMSQDTVEYRFLYPMTISNDKLTQNYLALKGALSGGALTREISFVSYTLTPAES